MTCDLIAGFGDEQRAALAQELNGADLVVLGHELDRLADQPHGVVDQIVKYIVDVRADPLGGGLRVHRGGQLLQGAGGHVERSDVKVDAEERRDLAVLVPDVDGRGFEQLAGGGFGQIAQPVLGLLGVNVLAQLLEHDLRRAVADLAPGNVAVFDGDDGMVGVVFPDFVDDDLAAAAELGGNALGDLAQRVKLKFF